jgi:glycosyltransferase involved in cell wall biosynthesis
MANGTPVIATNRGGPLEIIDDGVDGLFYDGSVKDLIRKINIIYEDTKLQQFLSKNALKKIIKKFDFHIQLTKLYELITKE